MCLHIHKRNVFGFLYLCFCRGMLGLESLKSLALSVFVAQNEQTEKSCALWSRTCRTRSEAQCIALATTFPVLLLLGNLRAWCHFHNLFSKLYSLFWKSSSGHDQPKLMSIDAFHNSLHAVPELLLRRLRLCCKEMYFQMPSFLNNSVILTAAVIYSLLLLVLM